MSKLALKLIAENKKTKAKSLDLGNCGMTEVPEEVGDCVWLEELILSNSWWEWDPEKKKGENKGSQNKGASNKIEISPAALSRLLKLKKIVFSETQISDLKPIANLINLQDLNCSSTQVSDLSPLSGLINLQDLNCSSTQVSDLSPLSGLVNLQNLRCSSTQISDLTPIANLINLQNLDCNFTQVSDLTPLANLINLQNFDCETTQVSDLTPLANLINLQNLDCDFTQVSDLTPLANLINLQTLCCCDTQVSDLTPLANLINLQNLDCYATQVSDLTPLANLTNLQNLYCPSTQVSNLSPLANLINLQTLDCETTQVSDLTPLANLTNLQNLYCPSTQVSNLSPLANLINLQNLYCHATQISDLKPILPLIKKGIQAKWATHGNGILLENCPLTTPPPEIVKQGNEAILNYFREREQGATAPIREVKLLILGEGGAGKTTLARKLLNGHKAPMPKESESTHGIEINSMPFQDKSGETYTAHLWDFGGQEIYHATHQFFLTKRSVYVLVTDARKEDTDFNYWLQIVELLSDNSPVFIIQNRKGGRQRDINLSGLQGRFGNIRDYYSIDLTLDKPEDRLKMDRLREAIEFEIRHLPHLNDQIPVVWSEVRRELENLKKEKPFITDQEYLSIAEKHGLNEERAQFLGRFLHDLGVFLYFQNDPILKRWLFLNNEWATDGVYSILDAPVVRDEKKGRFTRTDADSIWQEQESYRRMRDELLQLMMRFELCYRIPELQPETFIAPQLLSAAEPEAGLAWNNADNLQLRYQYEFMPKGLLSRFIVRLHRYIHDAEKEAWKTGVILHRQAASAKVVETYGVRHLHVRASGSRAKELVTVIAEEIDRLNDGYHNLRVQKLVPCNCPVCRKRSQIGKESEPPNFYEYQDLLTRQERGKATVECKYSYQDVNVLRLIDDVFVTTFFSPKVKKVFISYSKSDKSYLDDLQKQLKPLVRQELIEVWDDTRLKPGAEWDKSIRQELLTADIILLLVSSDLMATDYVWEIEMKTALERHMRGEAVVIPVIIRPCMWKEAPFAQLSALPAKGRPVSKWESEDEAWQEVVEKIRLLV